MAHRAYGFVPARGGSTGIPGKNLRLLAGKSLVARAIETLRRVPGLSSVILSTDSDEIARAGREAGAEVPFRRPAELATAHASVIDAIAHALAWLDDHAGPADWIVMVQPTSPFVCAETVAAILDHAIKHNLAVVQSVSPVKDHPFWVRVPAGLTMRPFAPASGSLRRQDLPKLVVLNGAVNVYRADVIRAKALPECPGYYRIDRLEGLDIDEEFDLRIAELIAASNEAELRALAREELDVSH
jgi:CMP-N-acetylneuraminic acid synthetase